MTAVDETVFKVALAGGYAAAAAVVVALWLKPAPYGRHRGEDGSGGIPGRLAWSLMESPALFLPPIFFFFFSSSPHDGSAPLAALLFFIAHYSHRVLLYPLRLVSPSRVPFSIFSSAFAFNVYNAYLQGRSLSVFSPPSDAWLASPLFWVAAALFAVGMATNIWADSVLIGLRKGKVKGRGGYSIPRGGLFELVTCPNYLGEVVEWVAWAAMTRSAAGLLFAATTAANLVPRAVAHHRWYRETFGESYPASRKALIPFVL